MAYDHEKLRKYILGELSEDDAGEFDELVVCDPDFADELSAVESELLDAFAAGELDAPTSEKVRRHYSATAYRRRKLAFAETVRDAARVSVDTGESRMEIAENSFWTFLSAFGKPVWAAIGVLVLFGVVLIAWRLGGRDERVAVNEDPTPAPTSTPVKPSVSPTPAGANVDRIASPTPTTPPDVNRNQTVETPTPRKPVFMTFVLRPSLRGSESIRTLAVKAETRDTMFGLKLEPNDFESFDVVLADESGGRKFWSGNGIKSVGGSLSIPIRSELPRNQVLVFTVNGVRDGKSEPLGTYVFRLENR